MQHGTVETTIQWESERCYFYFCHLSFTPQVSYFVSLDLFYLIGEDRLTVRSHFSAMTYVIL